MPKQDTEAPTEAQPQSPKRRYLALRRRAQDQAGKPEGDLCRRLADKLAASWPQLIDADELQPVALHEFRWKKFHERELLIRAIKYFGFEPLGYTGRSSRTKVVIAECDEPTRCLIEQAAAAQRDQLWDVINYAIAGYFRGSMPLPVSDHDADDADDAAEFDEEMIALAMAAMRLGARGRPLGALPEQAGGQR